MPNSLPKTHRARDSLTCVGRAYPHAWDWADRMRAKRGKQLLLWEDWCFLPMDGAHGIVLAGREGAVPYEHKFHISLVCALVAWRVSQTVFRFDQSLYEALIATPLPADLPADPLFRLPLWCVYIETPGMVWPVDGRERLIHGVWAHLNQGTEGDEIEERELRLVLDTADSTDAALDPRHGCIPLPIPLGAGTLAESLGSVFSNGFADAKTHGLGKRLPNIAELTRTAVDIAWPILSLILYLCADEAEIGDGSFSPGNPLPKRTKGQVRFFPPDRLTTWDVGVRIGSALREAHLATQRDTASQPTGRRVIPHIRNAHWHSFVTGPRSDPSLQRRRVKWLPPIAVNVKDGQDLPTVIRPVKA